MLGCTNADSALGSNADLVASVITELFPYGEYVYKHAL